MKRGLHIALADARRRGAAEGSAEAAEAARKPLVRRTVIAGDARAQAFARALAEMDDHGFGGDDVHAE